MRTAPGCASAQAKFPNTRFQTRTEFTKRCPSTMKKMAAAMLSATAIDRREVP